MAQPASPARGPVRWAAVTILLTVAIAAILWVPLYARSLPRLGGFPFFYWYQLVLVPSTAAMTWICHLLLRTRPTLGARSADGEGARE